MTIPDLLELVKAYFLQNDKESAGPLADAFLDHTGDQESADLIRDTNRTVSHYYAELTRPSEYDHHNLSDLCNLVRCDSYEDVLSIAKADMTDSEMLPASIDDIDQRLVDYVHFQVKQDGTLGFEYLKESELRPILERIELEQEQEEEEKANEPV